MIETLAFVTIIVTQDVDPKHGYSLPEGSTFTLNQPLRCGIGIDQGIKTVELMGGKADGYCDYTFAPARSIRPKARGDK